MIIDKPQTAAVSQVDLTPLINIVFLMLVFFMLAGSLVPPDSVQPATVDSRRQPEQELLLVSVNQQGVALIGAAAVSDEDLRTRLLDYQSTGGRVGIRPDARLQAQRLVEITALVREAGYEEMTLVTQTDDDS